MAVNAWTPDTAARELRVLADAAQGLMSVPRGSAEHVRWVVRVRGILEELFGEESDYYQTFVSLPWGRSGTFIVGGPADPAASMNPAGAIEREHWRAYQQQLDGARGMLHGAADEIDRKGLPNLTTKTAPQGSNELLKVINAAERKLRKLIREIPTREREVQDALENLLIAADIPYAREAERIEYSSKTYTPDFTLADIDLAVDVKLCGREDREKEIIAEINDDILAYQTRHKNVLFVVYDTGLIRDVDRFVGSFEQHESVVVRVVKH